MTGSFNLADNRLEVATKKGDYEYWLTQEDIADIARIEYLNFRQGNDEDSFRAFDIIGSPQQLRSQLLSFIARANHVNNARLTLIVNLAQQHWVTLLFASQDKNYVGYYVDSTGNWLPETYQTGLENIFASVVNLSGYFQKQEDVFNCGLWALENAEDLTRMIDERKGPHWITHRLLSNRGPRYFSERRRLLSSKLSEDPVRQARLSEPDQPISVKETHDELLPPEPILPRATADNPSKKRKLTVEKVKEKQDLFVKLFIQAFATRLAAYSLIAKSTRLTAEALKAELKTGFVGALWGVTLTQNLAGSIPSVVATVRNISASYFTRKKKAQKITSAFSEINSNDLSESLAQSAIEIFQSYEQQFLRISDKAGHYTALDKLADDAAGRALNYLDVTLTPTTLISSEIIALGILTGKSETYFDPSLQRARIRFTGNHIQDEEGHNFSTASLFEKVGLVIKSKDVRPDRFYKKNVPQSTLYGYRRTLSWETDSSGALKASEQSKYISETPINLIPYDYQLNSVNVQQEAIQALQRISTPNVIIPRGTAPPKNIIFNLRQPLKNFSGRSQPLIDLHRLLSTHLKTAVVTHKMEELSLTAADRLDQPLQESIQAAVSGLGGIGKTQLALQYAKQHAADYDYNVLWIDSEKKINIVESFKKLAIKLAIDLNDANGIEKGSDQVIEEVYDFFATAKSLFIFDNVENAKEIEDILPPASRGNKPTIVITSRYTRWKNIATPLQLGVFTETEARVFIKTELSIMDNNENVQITELTNLLQSLPLALQQALAYIHSEKTLNSRFSIQNYIDRFKQKQTSQELLNFDISRYGNDPYSKTILTTWEITLDKIKKQEIIGRKAIETLQMMAYLYPDNIANSIFLQLPNNARLGSAIHLLKAYSLINEGSQPDISTIHRLVQKILRIKLESNPSEFEKIVRSVMYLTGSFTKSKELMSHYFTFLLHMLEHKDLTFSLNLSVNNRVILESLTYYAEEKTLVNDLFDFAHSTLSRRKYLEFIGEALVIYMRQPFIISLSNVLDYLDEKINAGLISLEETQFILDLKYTLTRENYKDLRFSSQPARRNLQFNAIIMVNDFEHKLFPKDGARICQNKKRRSTNTLCSPVEDERLIKRPMDTQQIKTYIKKVRVVANLANLALLSKDTLSALIQGDFESVAINFALLSSSRVFGKLSNKLLITGEEHLTLGDEKLPLQKELDYDGKVAASLFTDKEIMLAGKRRFLGNAMKAASPFIARGTSLFFAYNFVKGISNNRTDWLDNLSNGAIVALDIGEAGIEAAEYLGYIVGVSEVTGPIGETLALLAILSIQLYHVEKELKAIEAWVHLSGRQRFVEGMRAFFNFQPSEYLETKANNMQLADKAINLLKLHPEIQYYLFSSWLPHYNLSSNHFVFLDRRRNILIDRDTIPERPTLSDFFCLEGMRPPTYINNRLWIEEKFDTVVGTALEEISNLEEKNSFLCINTLGIEYPVNRTNNITLVALEGNASVIGPDSTTIYVTNDGHQIYLAGDEDDLFILHGTRITGLLQGNLGVNIVKFSDYQSNEDSVLLDPQGFLCGKNVTTTLREEFFVDSLDLSNSTQPHGRFPNVGITVVNENGSAYTQLPYNQTTHSLFEEFCIGGLQLSNITQLYGRKKKQDRIFLAAGITVVDTYEGENETRPDYIYITENASKHLNIALKTDTVVHFLPRNSTDNLIIYKIPINQIGNAYVRLPFNDKAIHQFYFESRLDNVEALSIKNNIISFKLSYPDGCFNLTIENTHTHLSASHGTATPFFIQNASYIFNKNLEIKLINKKTVYGQWHGNSSVDETIQVVAPMAHRIDKAMIIQTSQNETIAIGGRNQEVLSTDGIVINHLVGNAGDALYVIQTPDNMTDPFPLNDISLYNLENNTRATITTADTLDLRDVLKKAQSLCGTQTIVPAIDEDKQDLILTLNTNYGFSPSTGCTLLVQSSYPLLKILLKNALNNYWHADLDIILDDHPINIIYDEDNWKLVPIPLTFFGNKNIILITDDDIKQNDEIYILKNVGEYEFIRHNGTDLILTNLFNNVTEAELYTIFFSGFFTNSLFEGKIVSLNLSFLDESLPLREHVEEIHNATDFYLQIKSYFNESQVFLNQSSIFFNNSIEQPILRPRREITAPFPSSSGASVVTPNLYNLFFYFPLQIVKIARLMLNNFYAANDNTYLAKEGSAALKKDKPFTALHKEKTNLAIYCNKNTFFAKKDCWKNQSSLGLLGYCDNSKQGITWFIKQTEEIPKLSWFAITDYRIPANLHTHHLNTPASNLSLDTNNLNFLPQDGCHQVINLNKISNTTLSNLFPYLPPEGKHWLLTQWRHEKNIQEKLLQDKIVISLFKQQSLQVGLNYCGNTVLLHTFIGDFLNALGLLPNWRESDPSYFLARWMSAIQQIRMGGTNQTSTIAAALLETALLHSKLHVAYSIWPNIKIRQKKQVLRFCADLLQWGNLNFALMPSLLDIIFADYLPIQSITWGLRAAISFYSINNDFSYYYLGICLCLLPQLPFLLEHLGIPLTAYVNNALESPTQLDIFKSLREQLKPTPDQSRLLQQRIELQAAEQRVSKGRARVAIAVKPLISFFKLSSSIRGNMNPSENETYYNTTYSYNESVAS